MIDLMPMIVQILLGGFLIILSSVIAGLGFTLLEAALRRGQGWLARPPHWAKMLILLCSTVAWVMAIAVAAIWLWALAFLWLEVFATLEASVYFSIVSFTTLGFGDVLLPQDWRLLAGIIALNGLLMIGLQTAMLIEVLRKARAFQADSL